MSGQAPDGLDAGRPQRSQARSRRPPHRPARRAPSRPAGSTLAPARRGLGHLTSPMMRSHRLGGRVVGDDEGLLGTARARHPGHGRRDGAVPPAASPAATTSPRSTSSRAPTAWSMGSPTRERPAPERVARAPDRPGPDAPRPPRPGAPHRATRTAPTAGGRVVHHARVAALPLHHAPEHVERRAPSRWPPSRRRARWRRRAARPASTTMRAARRVTSDTRSGGPPPRSRSRHSRISSALPTVRPSGASMSVITASVRTPACAPMATIDVASAAASACDFMNAPSPHLTSRSSALLPSASFLLMIEAEMSGMLSTVAGHVAQGVEHLVGRHERRRLPDDAGARRSRRAA